MRGAGANDVVWVTNVASPYRRPVWAELAERCDLRIALLEPDDALRRDGRRGDDWASRHADGLVTWHPRVIRVARGERILYALLGPLGLRRHRTRAVLIGGWESPAFWQTLVSARAKGIRCVGFYESTIHTNRFTSGPIAWARGWFFRSLDAIVVPGAAAREAVESFGVAPERIVEGFNAVDVAAFHSGSSDRTSTPGHRFVYVGQFIGRKNLRALIEAFSAVRRQGDTLTLIGDGPERATLERHATRLGVADAVEVRHPVPNARMPEELAHFDTLALVSSEEVWGLVVNEALAAGLHAVVVEDAGVAASVRGMPGVFETATTVDAIGEALSASRAAWRGRIHEPEILAYTPERFAETFARALGVGVTES